MPIPKQFKIGGMTIKVEIVDDLYNKFGEYNCATNTITLAKNIDIDGKAYEISEEIMTNTFYHELFHVFHYLWNTEVPEDEAQVYANFLMEFIQTKIDY